VRPCAGVRYAIKESITEACVIYDRIKGLVSNEHAVGL